MIAMGEVSGIWTRLDSILIIKKKEVYHVSSKSYDCVYQPFGNISLR